MDHDKLNDFERVQKLESHSKTKQDDTVENINGTKMSMNISIDNLPSTSTTSIDFVGTSLPETSMTSNDEINGSSSKQKKLKRSISKGETNEDSGVSIEKSGNTTDEDSSKRQRSYPGTSEQQQTTSTQNREDGTTKFHKLKSKVKKRNYRSKVNIVSESGENSNDVPQNDSVNNVACETNDSTRNHLRSEHDEDDNDEVSLSCSLEPDFENEEGDSNEWTTASEEDVDEEGIPLCLKKDKPKVNWFVVQEVMSREIGSNQLFQRRFHGSLHAVERLELMYKLNEHQGCVNALNFNQKGNLLASGSDDLTVVIWDWAIGKKRHCFMSSHRSNLFQAKWLPFDAEYSMVTCARDGQVRLMDLRRGTSRRIAYHRGPTHKISVHPDTPHVILSAGEDAKVLSIDIRESKPSKLLTVKDGHSEVQLYSINSNPLNSNEFCIGGHSPTVRIYDRRKVVTPLHKLCPDYVESNKHAYVTSAVYNYNGTEILASYNDEDIYLFDTVAATGDFAHKYQGHRNNATIKSVNFFGPKSEYVVSGSDCGNIFIWDKNTEAIVQWMAGDEQGVVNVLEPHPHIPVLATSGLDSDVKIWIPSCEHAPTMKNLETCVKGNLRDRRLDSASNAIDNQMLWVLLRNLHRIERMGHRSSRLTSENQNTGNNENDEDNDDENDDNDDNDDVEDNVGGIEDSPSDVDSMSDLDSSDNSVDMSDADDFSVQCPTS